MSFATTNGDVLAAKLIVTSGHRDLVISGDFTEVRTPDGVQHPAANLAVVNDQTGALVYAATSISSAGYVRALTYHKHVLYAGGDFTTYNGLTRHHVVAISTTTWSVTSWNPAPSGRVESLAAGVAAIYLGGGFGKLESVSAATGKVYWSDRVTGGGVRALLFYSPTRRLYAGGFFSKLGTSSNHGLVELHAKTGTVVAGFAPDLKPNSGTGKAGSYNGEDPMTLALNKTAKPHGILMGSGGYSNYVRMLNMNTGAFVWSHYTVGDTQAVTMVGTSAIVGYHRNQPNPGTFGWPFYIAQLSGSKGKLQSWNAGLSGKPAEVTDGLNNGIRGLVYDHKIGRLFVVGAFTTYGATCNPDKTVICTGGRSLDYVAAYTVTKP